MSEDEILDPTAVARLRRLGGDEFVGKMIAIFLSFVPQKLAAARAGLVAGDLKAVGDAVHPLKSSAGGIGARVMFELAGRMERLAMQHQPDTLPGLLDELDAAFALVRPRLEALRPNPKP